MAYWWQGLQEDVGQSGTGGNNLTSLHQLHPTLVRTTTYPCHFVQYSIIGLDLAGILGGRMASTEGVVWGGLSPP